MLTSALSLLPSFSPIIPDSTGISNFTNQTLPNLTSDPRLTCDKRYGEDLSVASCRHALQKILRSSESHRFTRGRKKPQASSDQTPTPIRYLSDDGICAIDITLAEGRADDEASGDLISDCAKSVLEHCVVGKHKGGTIVNFSRFKNLRISIWKYEPYVDCNPNPSLAPSVESCDSVLTLVPSYDKTILFTFTTDRRITYGRLPRHFSIDSINPSSCVALVTMPSGSPPTMARWVDIWAAGVAVNIMCIQHGFTGEAVWLGESEQISISLNAVGPGIRESSSAGGVSNLSLAS